MFGDGINDAPTLAAADVSLSFSEATDLANVSSDFIILGDSVDVLADARELAQRTRRNILQNFAWAGGYNLLAVPFAAAGYIPPWGAAIGMSLSSLIVVMNALRLQSEQRDKA
jgi:Cu2+-exporting ATPase